MQMNDVLSLGQHRVWKRMAVKWSRARAGQRALDVCCGSGDIAFLLAQAVGPSGEAWPPQIMPLFSIFEVQMLIHGRTPLNLLCIVKAVLGMLGWPALLLVGQMCHPCLWGMTWRAQDMLTDAEGWMMLAAGEPGLYTGMAPEKAP